MKTLKVKLSAIKPNPENPRIIRDDKFKKLVQSLKDFPEMLDLRPVVVNAKMVVLVGNMRLNAAEAAGLKELPVVVAKLTKEQEKEFIIKDNSSFGEWNWELLANEWDTEKLQEWGLELPVTFGDPTEATEDDYEIPEEIKTDIVLGDLFEIGEHRLLCGDCTESENWERLNIKPGFAAFTSPPYNVSNNAKLVGNTHAAHRESLYQDSSDSDVNYDELLSKSLKNAVDFCDGVAFNVQPLANNKINLLIWISSFQENFNEIITWNKTQAAPAMAKGVCSAAYEWLVVFSKKKTRTIPLSSWRGTLSNVYNAPPQRNNEFSKHHAATFPIHLPTFVITQLMNICTGVVDCFMGTGTTMVAAHQLNRKCYGMELDPKYCQVIIDRMLKLDPNIQIKKNGKKYLSPPREASSPTKRKSMS